MAVFHHYLELKACKPRLKRLYDQLSENLLNTKFDVQEKKGKTWEELDDIIQARINS